MPPAGDPQGNRDLPLAKQAFWLTVKIVVVNLGLYIFLLQLASYGIIYGNSVFPSLVLFLCFAISIGILLIIGLGQAINLDNIKNEWIKKIGVNPIMVIVATILSILAAFSGLGKLIIPDPVSFMLAKVGVTCIAPDKTVSGPEATDILAVISSGDEAYITQVDDFLNERAKNSLDRILHSIKAFFFRHEAKFADIKFVNKNNPSDEIYNSLLVFSRSGQNGSEGLSDEMKRHDRWLAYKTQVSHPTDNTSVPIPTIYDKNHKTRLFLILNEPPKSQESWVTALKTPLKSLAPLFQVEIVPKMPYGESAETDLDVRVFYNDPTHICWRKHI